MINHAEVITEQFHEIEELKTDMSVARIALQTIRDTCMSENLTDEKKVAECFAEAVHSLSLLTTRPTWID